QVRFVDLHHRRVDGGNLFAQDGSEVLGQRAAVTIEAVVDDLRQHVRTGDGELDRRSREGRDEAIVRGQVEAAGTEAVDDDAGRTRPVGGARLLLQLLAVPRSKAV